MSSLVPQAEPACLLAQLRSDVEGLLDSDQLLPADGRALLAMLEQAQERVEGGGRACASGLLLGFEILLKALLDTGVLDPVKSRRCIVAAHATVTMLSQTPA